MSGKRFRRRFEQRGLLVVLALVVAIEGFLVTTLITEEPGVHFIAAIGHALSW